MMFFFNSSLHSISEYSEIEYNIYENELFYRCKIKENTKLNKLIFIQESPITLIYNILRGFMFDKDKYLTHNNPSKLFYNINCQIFIPF
jgi:hypothetical protein